MKNLLSLLIAILPSSIKAQIADEYSTEGKPTPISEVLLEYEINPWADSRTINVLHEGAASQDSIDSLIQFLRQKNPSLFKFPSLVFHSRSLQSATPQDPRAILMSENAQTFIAFNGHLNQTGGDRLEVIHFNSEKNQYEFTEIKQDGAKLSIEINPSICFDCHTNRAPLWDGYNGWPRFMTAMTKEFQEENPDGRMIKMWEEFKASAASNLRYRHLDLLSNEKNHFDYNAERMTVGVQFWNSKRLASAIREKDPQNKYGALLQDLNEQSYIWAEGVDLEDLENPRSEIASPEAFLSKLSSISGIGMDELRKQYQLVLKIILTAEKDRHDDQVALLHSLSGNFGGPEPEVVTWSHVQVVLHQLGLDLRDFALGTPSVNYDFSTPERDMSALNYWITNLSDARKAHEQAASLHNHASPVSAETIIFTQCASCHTDGQRGPILEGFKDEAQLKLKLKEDPMFGNEILSRIKSTNVKNRMPYGYPPLGSNQIEAVKNLITTLSPKTQCSEIPQP